ncbi:hypothetical protein F4802DRAFT_504324 [Xylaria palmicola]|nr:hypothetical protein F4802DRAFT_504324 [Xylaria palmicola]
MSSPVKTAPTSLDRNDRFGSADGSLAQSLPMPGLSGRANSPTGDDQQATSSRAPSTMTESSRTPRSWSASNLTSRPKSTSRHASAATSSWGYTKCGYHQQQQERRVPASSRDDDQNALITGLFFLGGSHSDKGGEFQYGNIRVHLQTTSQGFVFGVGRGSASVLRITLRFTLSFMDEENFDSGGGREGTETEWGQNDTRRKQEMDNKGEPHKQGDESRPEGQEAQHSLSLSLTMTITIMAINTTTLS